jgi:nucleotidyltransferase substrate binding protein (TIGR01987 family)
MVLRSSGPQVLRSLPIRKKNMSCKIDYGSLVRALGELEEILEQPKNKYIVSGTIQCFEFTFELSWKMLQRTLKVQGVTTGSPMQVFRAGKEAGFIDSIEVWAGFLKQRNLTTHTYNKDTAEEIYLTAQAFPAHVKELLRRMEEDS